MTCQSHIGMFKRQACRGRASSLVRVLEAVHPEAVGAIGNGGFGYGVSVAQSCILLYRRFSIGAVSAKSERSDDADAQPTASRRLAQRGEATTKTERGCVRRFLAAMID